MEPIYVPIALLGLFAASIVYLLYQLVTKGMTGILFDARILHRSGTVKQDADWLNGGYLNVLVLKTGRERKVGIRIVETSWFYWHEHPVKLDKDGAQKLIDALEDAIAHA